MRRCLNECAREGLWARCSRFGPGRGEMLRRGVVSGWDEREWKRGGEGRKEGRVDDGAIDRRREERRIIISESWLVRWNRDRDQEERVLYILLEMR